MHFRFSLMACAFLLPLWVQAQTTTTQTSFAISRTPRAGSSETEADVHFIITNKERKTSKVLTDRVMKVYGNDVVGGHKTILELTSANTRTDIYFNIDDKGNRYVERIGFDTYGVNALSENTNGKLDRKNLSRKEKKFYKSGKVVAIKVGQIDSIINTTSDHADLDTALAALIDFRYKNRIPELGFADFFKSDDDLVNALYNDQVIDSKKNYSIKISAGKLYVNGKKLTDEQYLKYKPYMKNTPGDYEVNHSE